MKMKELHLNNFEQNILKGLVCCKVDLDEIAAAGTSVGVAVSGGADSTALLCALNSILKSKKIPLKVITVNHYIREDEATCGDVKFVQELCEKLDVLCYVHELKRGEVIELGKAAGIGVEGAARELRYRAFNQFIEKENLSCLCLAHNQNDQLETILMRFLQGAFGDSSGGIPMVRGKFVRPLLNITRNEIENYLIERSQSWRTDSTNSDDKYLRNKIRNNLIPLLNKDFEGWNQAVLCGAEKSQMDKEIIAESLNAVKITLKNEAAVISRKEFEDQKDGIKYRLLIKAMNLIGVNSRISYGFLVDVIKNNQKDVYSKVFENVEISFKKDQVLIKKCSNFQTDFCFSDIINKEGNYNFPFGEVKIFAEKEGLCIASEKHKVCINAQFPIRIRSYFAGDEVVTGSGNLKKVRDVFSDWHVSEEKRLYIPVIEDLNKSENKIICILGGFSGFKDWIVK